MIKTLKRMMTLAAGILALLAVFSGFAARAADEKGAPPPHQESSEKHVDEVKINAEAVKQYGITLEPVRRQALSAVFTAPARIAFNAEAMAHVGTPVEGRVAEIRARLGDNVKQGDVLLVIDSPPLGEAQSDFLQKKTAVEVARTTLEVSQTAYDRAKSLLEGKGLSLGEFQRREGEYKISKGNLMAAESSALADENKLHLYGMSQAQIQTLLKSGEIDARYSVRSPISGKVVEKEVTLGEIVGSDREPLLVLADVSTLWVLADVPEARISQVSVGSPARVYVSALEQKVFSGKVDYVAPQLNAATRSAQARIQISGGQSGLQPGMFGQVELKTASADRATSATVLAVPAEAVQTVEGGAAVFVPVAGEENTFAKRTVTVGPRVGNLVPILSGLKENETVVLKGSFILKAELGKASAAHED